MMKETLKEFHEWYENIPDNLVFDFQKEILEYCKSDVQILPESCQIFLPTLQDNKRYRN